MGLSKEMMMFRFYALSSEANLRAIGYIYPAIYGGRGGGGRKKRRRKGRRRRRGGGGRKRRGRGPGGWAGGR